MQLRLHPSLLRLHRGQLRLQSGDGRGGSRRARRWSTRAPPAWLRTARTGWWRARSWRVEKSPVVADSAFTTSSCRSCHSRSGHAGDAELLLLHTEAAFPPPAPSASVVCTVAVRAASTAMRWATSASSWWTRMVWASRSALHWERSRGRSRWPAVVEGGAVLLGQVGEGGFQSRVLSGQCVVRGGEVSEGESWRASSVAVVDASVADAAACCAVHCSTLCLAAVSCSVFLHQPLCLRLVLGGPVDDGLPRCRQLLRALRQLLRQPGCLLLLELQLLPLALEARR